MRTTDSSKAYVVALGGLLAMAAVMGIGRFVYTPILPTMLEALGLTKSQAGIIASANYFGYLAGAVFAMLPLPGGKRAWFLGALCASAATTAGMAGADTTAAFALIRAVGGFASAIEDKIAQGKMQMQDENGKCQQAPRPIKLFEIIY